LDAEETGLSWFADLLTESFSPSALDEEKEIKTRIIAIANVYHTDCTSFYFQMCEAPVQSLASKLLQFSL